MDVATVDARRTMRLRMLGTALLLLAALLVVGSFVAVARMPTYDVSTCIKTAPCDPSGNFDDRARVFFLWIGATLIVLAGGVWFRSVANRPDVAR
jgi:hypothetical protein